MYKRQAFDDCTGGIGFYQFLEETAKHFEEKKGEVIAKLKETAARLFTKENMLISYTAAADDQAGLEAALPLLKERLPQGDGTVYPFEWKKENLNEGFMTSSQVNYLARCGNFVEKGLAYKGTLRTLKVILGYDCLLYTSQSRRMQKQLTNLWTMTENWSICPRCLRS